MHFERRGLNFFCNASALPFEPFVNILRQNIPAHRNQIVVFIYRNRKVTALASNGVPLNAQGVFLFAIGTFIKNFINSLGVWFFAYIFVARLFVKGKIVVANILADVIIPMAPVIPARLKKGGIFITSGIIDFKENQVKEAIEAVGLEVVEINHQGEWVNITARKN